MRRSRPSQARPLRVSRMKSREGIAARISRNFLGFGEQCQDQEGGTHMGVDRSYHGIGVNSGRSSSEYVCAAFEFGSRLAQVGVAVVAIVLPLSRIGQNVAGWAGREIEARDARGRATPAGGWQGGTGTGGQGSGGGVEGNLSILAMARSSASHIPNCRAMKGSQTAMICTCAAGRYCKRWSAWRQSRCCACGCDGPRLRNSETQTTWRLGGGT